MIKDPFLSGFKINIKLKSKAQREAFLIFKNGWWRN